MKSTRGGEDGAVIVMAMVFVTVVAVVVVAMLTLSVPTLRTTGVVQDNRTSDYAADGTMTRAIAAIRFNPSLCTANRTTFDIPDAGLRVDCTTRTVVPYQRELQLQVCPSSGCAGAPLVEAEVHVYDHGPIGRSIAIKTWSTK